MIILRNRQTEVQKSGQKFQRFFHFSKWLHKYVGLVIILFMLWMSVTGILMNHPGLISGISVPAWLLPPQYHVQNWNRSALIHLVFSSRNPQIAFACGKAGIWKSEDGGKTFEPMMTGLPASAYYRKTKQLLLLENDNLLLAATDGGLFSCSLDEQRWQAVPLGDRREKVLKIVTVREQLLAATPSHFYISPMPPHPLDFRRLELSRAQSENRVSLVKLFFDLHDGKAWGLPGKLLFDATGLVMIFLSISAFYTWYFPWQRRRNKSSRLLSTPRTRRIFKLMFKYHLKIGIWVALILLIIGGTGLFMRPPLLVALAGNSIAEKWYPGFSIHNPWEEKIQNVLYDAVEDKVIIQCTDGFWVGDADFRQTFRETRLNAPVFVMGTTVFEPYGTGGYLVGSFNGIYHFERNSRKSIDLLSGKPAAGVSAVRPGKFMVTGYFKTPQGEEFITTHEQGLLPVGNAQRRGRFRMPENLQANPSLPLWNYFFEIHNGRFFKDVVGNLYILIAPLGSLLFLLITLTGIYDWIFQRLLRPVPGRRGTVS